MGMNILGFDPGRDKCGLAVMGKQRQLLFHEVITSENAIKIAAQLIPQYEIQTLVMGNQTTAKDWNRKLQGQFPNLSIIMVDERNSSLEARDLYWEMYPPRGLQRLIPQGMRLPPRPVDDLVAILLIERYLLQG
jgi:RNase H-fold protein (predicted Holliday junction resolvase)